MKYQYYNPNFRIRDFFKSLFVSEEKAEAAITQYFAKITGKKYMLITNSCRTALYLAYKSIGRTGDVITSPLTCKAAIDPIVESGNKPIYADVSAGDLNIDPADIEKRISNNVIAVQVIHLGGIACDMDEITEIAKRHKLIVIEDCAQSLGATYKNKQTGSFGDIACFSLIKNAYGIGGGVFATDSEVFYKKALFLNKQLKRTPFKLIVFRLIRNTIETYRKVIIGKIFFRFLFILKGQKKAYKSVFGQLYRVNSLEKKIAAHQISRYNKLHSKRRNIGKRYFELLSDSNLLLNKLYNPDDSSFTKLFLYSHHINTKQLLEELHKSGIEAMHLEHKKSSPYQEKLLADSDAEKQELPNYLKIHDSLVSLPIIETMSFPQIKEITEIIKKNL